MKKIILLITICGLCSCDPIKKLYAKFGEAKPLLENKNDSVIRLFFDRQGFLYPDIEIADKEIASSYSQLNLVFSSNKNIYKKACVAHGLIDTGSVYNLQNKLVEQKVALLNKVPSAYDLVFLIHGFNKHPTKPEKKSAYDEYQALRQKITTDFPSRKFQFVEIYWDGCTWANGRKSKENTNTFKFWDNSQAASNLVGLELRRILFGINRPKTYVITHSLGASVITCALFNADKFNLHNNINNFKRTIIEKYDDPITYRTPLSKFKVGMLAPAIPGENTFDEFSKRVPDKASSLDNYSFIIGYNANDQALIKKIGIPKYFGATSLGCLESEVRKVEKEINQHFPNLISDINFSNKDSGIPQSEHALLKYIRNTKPMNAFLNRLFNF